MLSEDATLSETQIRAKLDELRNLDTELEWVEFKEAKNNFDTDDLGKYFSALSNEANLKRQPCGWLVFGVEDNPVPRRVVGTSYRNDPSRLQATKQQIAQETNDDHTFIEIYDISHERDRVVMFQIPPALEGRPTSYKGKFYGRHGDSRSGLAEYEIQYFLKQAALRDLKQEIWSFDEELKVPQYFTGRTWAIQKIKQLIYGTKTDRGLFIVTAEPGFGKSALIAKLAHELAPTSGPAPVVFFYSYDRGRREPALCVRHLYASLLDRHNQLATSDCAAGLTDEDGLYERLRKLLVRVSTVSSAKSPAIILIDALDEGKRPLAYERLKMDLPAHVYVVATSRSNAPELNSLRPTETIALDGADHLQTQLSEGVEYSRKVLADVQPLPRDELFYGISQAGAGNFLVLELVCREVRRVGCQSQELDNIIARLATESDSIGKLGFIYSRYWDRLTNSQNEAALDRIFRVLKSVAFAQAPLSRDMLWSLADLGAVLWELVRANVTEYLDVSPAEPSVGAEERYRPYHATFAEFLRDRFAPEQNKCHANLARYCLGWPQIRKEYAREYALRFAPLHLAEVADWDRLSTLLTDVSFLEAKISAGLIADLIGDCKNAANGLPESVVDRKLLKEIAKALESEAGLLSKHSHCVYQCLRNHCSQIPDLRSADIEKKWSTVWKSRPNPVPWVQLVRKYPNNDPGIIHRLRGPRAPVLNIVTTDRICAAFSADGSLYVWDEVGQLQLVLDGQEKEFFVPLAIDNTSTFLLAATDGALAILDLAAKHETSCVRATFQRPANPLCAIASNDSVRTLLADGTLLEWSQQHGFSAMELIGNETLDAGALSPSGSWIAFTASNRLVGSDNNKTFDVGLPSRIGQALQMARTQEVAGQVPLQLWAPQMEERLRTQMRNLWNHRISLHASTGWVAVLEENNSDDAPAPHTLIRWHADLEGPVCQHWPGESCEVVSFADDWPKLALGTESGRICVLELGSESVTWSRKAHDAGVTAISWRTDDQAVASSGSSGTYPEARGDDNLIIVQRIDITRSQSTEVHTNIVTSLCSSPDGTMFASGDVDGRVALWNAKDGTLRSLQVPERIMLDRTLSPTDDLSQCIAELWRGHPCAISRVDFTADNRTLISASDDATIWLWNTEDGAPIGRVSVDGDCEVSPKWCCMDVSADGRVVAAMDASGTTAAWDIGNDFHELIREEHDWGVQGDVALSPDGQMLATVVLQSSRYNPQNPEQISSKFQFRIYDLNTGVTVNDWTTDATSGPIILRLAFVRVPSPLKFLLFGAADWRGDNWKLLGWNLSEASVQFDRPSIELDVWGSIGGFDYVMRLVRNQLGIESADRPFWQARPCKEHEETTFSRTDSLTAWYATAFDDVIGTPDGRTFCGRVGREIHFLRIEDG